MALQIIPQQNQPQGLAMLGATLAAGADDYAKRKLQLEDEARRRANQLADVESARGYEQQNINRLRTLQLEDEARRRTQGLQDLKTKAQLENRLQLLQQAELEGLFDPTLLGNMAAEDEALGKLRVLLATKGVRAAQIPEQAQSQADAVNAEMQGLRQELNEALRIASEPFVVDENLVKQRALDMARANVKPGLFGGRKEPSEQDIEALKATARKEVGDQAMIAWQIRTENAKQRADAARVQLMNLQSLQRGLPPPSIKPASVLQAPPITAPVMAAHRPVVSNPLSDFGRSLGLNQNPAVQPPPPAASVLAVDRPAESYAASGPFSRYDPVFDPMLNKIADFMRNPTGTPENQVTQNAKRMQMLQSSAPTVPISTQAQTDGMTRLLQTDAALRKKLVTPYSTQQVWTPGLLRSDGY